MSILTLLLEKVSPGFVLAMVLMLLATYQVIFIGQITQEVYALLSIVVAFYFGEASGKKLQNVVNGINSKNERGKSNDV